LAIRQDISQECSSEFDCAKRYYSMLFAIKGWHLSPKELDLISFSAVHGTLSTPPLRDEFLQTFNVKENYLNMILPKLRKQGFLVKGEDKKLRVNPKILHPSLSFKEDILLIIKLNNAPEDK